MPAIEIDGAQGEGGGQIVRTAAAMSACTGQPVRIVNARANRSSTGLRPQHVAAMEAIRQACDGELEGVEVGAERFSLEPGEVTGGRVRVDTGTAACVGLILHALAPLARRLDEPLELDARGGTDVRYAPTLEHVREAFVPFARRLGVPITIQRAREGFYPVGGGRIQARIEPAREASLEAPLVERGELEELLVRVRIAELDEDIARRILQTATTELASHGYRAATETQRVSAECPGVVVDAIATFEETVIAANAMGEKGVPSETVAQRLVQRLHAELASPATVDVHLADQMVPLAMGRSRAGYLVREVSQHLRTVTRVCERFLDGRIVFEDGPGTSTRVCFA